MDSIIDHFGLDKIAADVAGNILFGLDTSCGTMDISVASYNERFQNYAHVCISNPFDSA